jgi:hypothetical protein
MKPCDVTDNRAAKENYRQDGIDGECNQTEAVT